MDVRDAFQDLTHRALNIGIEVNGIDGLNGVGAHQIADRLAKAQERGSEIFAPVSRHKEDRAQRIEEREAAREFSHEGATALDLGNNRQKSVDNRIAGDMNSAWVCTLTQEIVAARGVGAKN